MGGIVSDFWGRSSLAGLSVCGECASTGAHGANRLASNSLLEAVVFAERIARRLRDATLDTPVSSRGNIPADLPNNILQELRHKMATDCAVVRDRAGLSELAIWLRETEARLGPARALIAARLIVEPALARDESRGGHFRSDHTNEAAPSLSLIHI